MNHRNYGWYAIAIVIAFVGALAFGVPVATLAILGLVLTCPLMMFFMMRGTHDGRNGTSEDPDRPERLPEHRHHG